jgi:hypothetical protein
LTRRRSEVQILQRPQNPRSDAIGVALDLVRAGKRSRTPHLTQNKSAGQGALHLDLGAGRITVGRQKLTKRSHADPPQSRCGHGHVLRGLKADTADSAFRNRRPGSPAIVRIVAPWNSTSRYSLVYLAMFALLFAPAGADGPKGSGDVARAPVDPRIIAPTVGEGMVAASATLTTRRFQVTEQRVQLDSLPLVIRASAAGLVFLWAAVAGAPRAGTRPTLSAARALVPRAPPALA